MKAMKAMKAMKKKTVSRSQPFKHKLFFYYNGQGNEGDEGHGSHEGHESHEEEDREQDRQGQNGKGIGLPWFQGEDRGWYDCRLFDQEQERQDREQEKVSVWQEECLDFRCDEGKEGIGPQGLRRNQEGLCSLQEGQGALSVNIHEHASASAQGVGMSTPFERRCFGLDTCVEHH